jgi:hypothetical protein
MPWSTMVRLYAAALVTAPVLLCVALAVALAVLL